MNNTDDHKQFARELESCASDDNLSSIDRDRYRQWLKKANALTACLQDATAELNLLREDYTRRIAAMVRAVAVVARKSPALKEAAEYIETLPSLSARELIRHFERASARLQSAFPASFPDPMKTDHRARPRYPGAAADAPNDRR